MPSGVPAYNSALLLLLAASFSSWPPPCAALPWTGARSRRSLYLDYSPAPPPEEGPPLSVGALRDPAFLPAQIGGIVGAYAFSLVLVALLLLAFSKRRRDHLLNRDAPPKEDNFFLEFNPFPEQFLQSEEEYQRQLEQFQKLSLQIPQTPLRNFSLPSNSPLSPTRTGPLSPSKSQRSVFSTSSPTSTILAPGIDLSVDQTIVGRDRAMAQQQLEEMYRLVMEQEQAKAEGRDYQPPALTSPSTNTLSASPAKSGGLKKERNKPSNLNLEQDEKQSRTSSMFSFLKSPRKNKAPAGLSISSPILTPMSGTFPRHDAQEMNAMPPRHYAPAAPPPLPSHDLPFRQAAASAAGSNHLPTPDISPVSTQSIDSRIDAAVGQAPTRAARREHREREARSDHRLPSHSRDVSSTATSTAGDHEPVSATSDRSTAHLVGLPVSPRPGVSRFPSDVSLPASPRPGQQTFQLPPAHANSSTSSFPRPSGTGSGSAVREGGALPLRAYEPSVSSPTAASFATKQTVFTRAAPGPLSPGMQTGMRTPWTGAPVPYTPYQPFSPVVPITPSVVTRADRKKMKRLEPKTPTVEMVRSAEDVW
ncbi:hypothetical protein N658DRAFT_494632 [Parathielavia hyrcaniae]|uniref:Uncharacterized protein n=1 Tax=Parathielavia hyrcaniae TaxID=113614 RepID=A0AAN6T430_9PEZI|nr:hypothetical protein N658DRAFT_494632 [Parathielavia hyrcaniae]